MISSREVTVLIVDDNDDHRLLMERALARADYTVLLAASGEEALEIVDRENVDLVLLDYGLPGMSGLTTLTRIRQTSHASVVMVTGMGSEDLVVQSMRAGAIDYLVKNEGYLRALPEVVRRAWRQHDLTRRADELQRLALLVTSETDREAMSAEIVRGARQLLAADSCALAVVDEDGTVAVTAMAGELPTDPVRLLDQAAVVIADPSAAQLPQLEGEHDRLFIPLPSADGEPLGVLMVVSAGPREFAFEELKLAQAFAAYAGTGLQNVRRLELERRLVDQLQQTSDARRDFVAAVSHELRTPLTCILGFSDTLASRWDQLEPDAHRRFLARIRDNAHELAQLVERLLDAASAERGEFHRTDLADVDLVREVNATVAMLAPILPGRDVLVEGDQPLVRADPSLVRRVVTNLVSNAVKYSAPEEPVVIRVDAAGGEAIVEVIDRGIGLSAQEAGRVFDPFWRAAHTVTSANRGTGLGLALVRQYVRSMGGRVGVTSQSGRGSTFRFTLPLAEHAHSWPDGHAGHERHGGPRLAGQPITAER